jgi:hypothetical protein
MKARLLKVIVQPIIVMDDGETLTEQVCQALTVPAKDWPDFSSKSLGQEDMERITAQFAPKQ